MKTKYRKLSSEGLEFNPSTKRLIVSDQAIKHLTSSAFYDLAFYLREDHLNELLHMSQDSQASLNERFVCEALIKNAIISAEGVLPLCQDTGTATIFAWRGSNISTSFDETEAMSQAIKQVWADNYLRHSQIAPISMFEEKNTMTNLPAQIDISYAQGNEYKFVFMAKGGGSANKTVLHQGSRALLNHQAFEEFLTKKITEIGVAACPPYTLIVVVGGTSPEYNLKMMKLASTGWLDELPEVGDGTGSPIRDKEWEKTVLKIAQNTGWGAQFKGKYMGMQARVIRLARHAGSCPVSIGVSCSAHRNAFAKITPEGIFLEELDKNPARLLPSLSVDGQNAAIINLNKPMPQILAQLSSYPPGTLLKLNGTLIVARDMAHARILEIVKSGKPFPEYILNHPVYYAGPAKTPPTYAIGSFGPTTAQRMDEYAEPFMSQKASLVSLAKGNRSDVVAQACHKHGGFYLGTIGGAAALFAKEYIKKSEVIDFKEFGMEAVHKITVENMPAFILYDDKGGSFY